MISHSTVRNNVGDMLRKTRFWDRNAGADFNDGRGGIVGMLEGFERKLTRR